jgi:hypothetical protein
MSTSEEVPNIANWKTGSFIPLISQISAGEIISHHLPGEGAGQPGQPHRSRQLHCSSTSPEMGVAPIGSTLRRVRSAPKPLRDPRLSFVKSDHWAKQLENTLRDVEADQHNGHESDSVLRDAALKLREAIAASKESCDADQVWVAGKLNCSLLASGFLFASGVLPCAAAGGLAGYKSHDGLLYPARYAYTESTNRLPLYVLVDFSVADYEHVAVVQGVDLSVQAN